MMQATSLRTFWHLSLGLLLGLIYNAPANVLNTVSAYLQWPIHIAQAQGHWWQGRGCLIYQEKNKNAIVIDQNIAWSINLWQSLRGHAGIMLQHSNDRAIIAIQLTPNSLIIDNFSWAVAPTLFDLLGEPWSNLRAQGAVTLSNQQPIKYHWNNQEWQGKMLLTWHDFSTPISPVNPLGDYRADINMSLNAITFQLKTQQGPLYIEGQGSISSKQSLQFTGDIRTNDSLNSTITNMLSFLGKKQANGAYAINIR